MPQKIRMWEVTPQNALAEISSSEINLEERLEDWLESDISMLAPDLLVIGRQVQTAFGGQIDLLCLDSNGDTVIVELKKGRTPREVTAQALDYASWVKDLSYQQLEDLAQAYLNSSLEEAFSDNFGEELPELINDSHRSLIVAEAMDASTERIVRYLSDMNVPINVATVRHFKTADGRELLAQTYLLEQTVAASETGSRSRRNLTLAQIQDEADQQGVGRLHSFLRERARGRMRTATVGHSVIYRVPLDGRTVGVAIVSPWNSSPSSGLYFSLSGNRLMSYLGQTEAEITSALPNNISRQEGKPWVRANPEERNNWFTLSGYFRTTEEIDRFLDLFQQ